MKGAEIFVFTDNLVFEGVFYKANSKVSLLFDIFLRLYQLKIQGELVLHIIPI